MTPLRAAAKAAYENWIIGVEGLEPKWEELPQHFIDRLIAAQSVALLAIINSAWPEHAIDAGHNALDEVFGKTQHKGRIGAINAWQAITYAIIESENKKDAAA